MREMALRKTEERRDIPDYYDLFRLTRLLPSTAHLDRLQRDYRAMQSMLFGSIPSFDEMMQGLSELEWRVNRIQD